MYTISGLKSGQSKDVTFLQLCVLFVQQVFDELPMALLAECVAHMVNRLCAWRPLVAKLIQDMPHKCIIRGLKLAGQSQNA